MQVQLARMDEYKMKRKLKKLNKPKHENITTEKEENTVEEFFNSERYESEVLSRKRDSEDGSDVKLKSKKKSKKLNIDQSTETEDSPAEQLFIASQLSKNEEVSLKRDNSEDDSDVEVKPKKKKKKKTPQPAETTVPDKKGKKSIRQMKKEKFAQRQAEAQVVAKDQFKSQCLNYLSQWKHDKSNWKFMKVKQVWLHKNKFSSQMVPDASWPVLLEYFESAKGNIRNMLLEDANKVIKQMDEWTETQNSVDDSETEDAKINKPDGTSYTRARDIIQCLHE